MAKRSPRYATAISFAGDFGRTAALFSRKALEVERTPSDDPGRFLEHTSFVSTSVIASAAFLEAFINDLLVELADSPGRRRWPERHELFPRLWALGIPRTASYSILEKYQITLIVSGQQPFTTGRNPYQDAQTVVALRNELIHYEPVFQHPDSVPAGEQSFPTHRLVARLRGKFALNPMCAAHAPVWPTKLLSAGCATWCAISALAFVEAFLDRLPMRGKARALEGMTADARKLLPQL